MDATHAEASPSSIDGLPLDTLLAMSKRDSVFHHAVERVAAEAAQTDRTIVAAFQSSY
jgi:hypothetical protein